MYHFTMVSLTFTLHETPKLGVETGLYREKTSAAGLGEASGSHSSQARGFLKTGARVRVGDPTVSIMFKRRMEPKSFGKREVEREEVLRMAW